MDHDSLCSYTAQFDILVKNARYSSYLALENNSITLTVQDYPCEFIPIENSHPVNEYSIKVKKYPLKYNSVRKTLTLSFDDGGSSAVSMNAMYSYTKILETFLENFSIHSQLISKKLPAVIKSLASQYSFNIVSLTHESSETLLKTQAGNSVLIKTSVADGGNHRIGIKVETVPKLLTTSLVDMHSQMTADICLEDLYRVIYNQSLALTADFQITLDEVLGIIASHASMEYETGSYQASGFVCIPNSYYEIHISYRKQ